MGRSAPGPAGPDPAEVGSFERAADALRAAGLQVNAWVVVTHNGRLAAAHPECAVHNAFGDAYPWALCAGSPARGRVRDRAGGRDRHAGRRGRRRAGSLRLVRLRPRRRPRQDRRDAGGGPARCWTPASAATARPRCGWPAWTPAPSRPAVRTALDGGAPGSRRSWPATLSSVRAATAATPSSSTWWRRCVTAAPGQQILVHAHPDPAEAGSNPGYELTTLLGPAGADGIILACPGPAAAAAAVASAAREVAAVAPGRRVIATLPAVAALGADHRRTAGQGQGRAGRGRDRPAAVPRGPGLGRRPRGPA